MVTRSSSFRAFTANFFPEGGESLYDRNVYRAMGIDPLRMAKCVFAISQREKNFAEVCSGIAVDRLLSKVSPELRN